MGTKIIFKKKNASDDYGGLYLETVVDGERKRESLGFKITKENFAKYFNKEEQLFNPNKVIDWTGLNEKIRNKQYQKEAESHKKANANFFEYFEKCRISQANPLTRSNYLSVIKKLKEFDKKLTFKAIDENMVNRFFQFMVQQELSVKTIRSYMTVFKTVLNKASRKSLFQFKYDYFYEIKYSNDDYDNQKILDNSDITKLLKFNDRSHIYFKTRCQFLFSLFCNGIRVSDMLLLKCQDFEDQYVKVVSKKTGKLVKIPYNDRMVQLLTEILGIDRGVIELVQIDGIDDETLYVDLILPQVLESIRSLDREYFFNYNAFGEIDGLYERIKGYNKRREMIDTEQNALQSLVRRYDNQLKRIKQIHELDAKKISTHSARYSFTNILLDMDGVNVYDISKSLGHSSIAITENYINKNFGNKAVQIGKKLSNVFANYDKFKEEEDTELN